jgi:hypothetical protein
MYRVKEGKGKGCRPRLQTPPKAQRMKARRTRGREGLGDSKKHQIFESRKENKQKQKGKSNKSRQRIGNPAHTGRSSQKRREKWESSHIKRTTSAHERGGKPNMLVSNEGSLLEL